MALKRLRPDLVVSEQTLRNQKTYIIKDPVRQRYFRFNPSQYALIRWLGEGLSIGEIQAKLGEEFTTTISADQVEQFLAHLEQQGLLEIPGAPAPEAPPKQAKSLLSYQFPMFDPSAALHRWSHSLEGLFTPGFLLIWGGFVAAGVALSLMNWEAMTRDVLSVVSWRSLPLLWASVFLLSILHEYAHALTCHHFGGQVKEIGFFFIYFQPAFYCDISDAWMFPNKWHRIAVLLAGTMIDLFTWAVAVLMWRIVDPGSPFHLVSVLVLTVNGAHSLINLFPLIKLDGYYLLSTWVGIPNLRQRAFRYVLLRLKSWFWSGDSTPVGNERWVYWGYGVMALGYSWFLLVWVFHGAFQWLMVRYQGQGFLLGVGLMLWLFHRPLTRWAWPAPGQAGGVIRKILVLVTVGGVLAGAGWMQWPFRVSSACAVVPMERAQISTPVPGWVEEIAVREGVSVKAGAVVARLATEDVEAAMAELEAQQERLDVLRAQAERDWQRNIGLRKKNLLSQQVLETSQKEVAVLKKQIKELEAKRTGHQVDLRRRTLVSPVDGVVITPHPHQLAGTYVAAGQAICEIQQVDPLWIEMAVPEKELADVKIGLPIQFKVSSYPFRLFQGRVESIGTTVTSAAGADGVPFQHTVVVRSISPNADLALKPGMTGYAKIVVGRRSGFSLAARRLVRWLRVEFWSLW